jgi:diadenosine tetraphosphate (Ap4A) HIT family hydrolase
MSKWNDAAAWRSLIDGTGCPICIRGYPLDSIATLSSSWVTMPENAPMPGYACLVSQIHAVELHHLSTVQAAAFMSDIHKLSRAVSQATGAVKLNYEIHGNTLPHLHMHFYPRHPGDPFENSAIDPRCVAQPAYGPGEFNAVVSRVLAFLEDALVTPAAGDQGKQQ